MPITSKASYKKKAGDLKISPDTITWKINGGSKDDVVIPMEQIKVQQVNVPGPTGKILLKLTLYASDNGPEPSFSFSFSNLDDREKIKDEIASQLGRIQKRQSTVPSTPNSSINATSSNAKASIAAPGSLTLEEIQIRQGLLTKNKDLAQLHKKLVISGLISEQEFWDSRKHILETERWNVNQKTGPSSAALADIKPDQDGNGSDLKYTLTPEIIHSIFAQYPAVLKAYQDNVPHNMSEKEFWTKYFKSKYFHRNRVGFDKDTKDDFFEKYIQEDQNDFILSPAGLTFEGKNKLLDLLRTSEDHSEHGNGPDVTMRAGSVKEALPLLRKFNRHSELILKQTLSSTKASSANAPQSKEAALDILDAETRIPDLEVKASEPISQLNISDPTKYFDVHTEENVTERPSKRQKKDMPLLADSWSIQVSELQYQELASNTVFEKLSSLTIRRKRDEDIFAVGRVAKSRVFPEIVDIQASANELQRHFWANLSTYKITQNKEVKVKLTKILEALKQLIVKMNAMEMQVGTASDQKLCKSLLATTRTSIQKAMSVDI